MNRHPRRLSGAPVMVLVSVLFACRSGSPAVEPGPWLPLFEEPARAQWVPSDFGGGGEITWSSEGVELGFGSPLTGLTWTGELPRDGYEVELTATRLDGTDFYCGLTFPVGEASCSFILGGWGGALTGLSCVDGADASSNATKSFQFFPNGERVAVRLVVDPRRVRVWLNGKSVVDQPREGVRFSLRPEVLPSEPFGVASFATKARLEGLRYRVIGAE